MWERIPGAAIARVVLAHGAPLSFREIRSPAPPRRSPLTLLDQSLALRRLTLQPVGGPVHSAAAHARTVSSDQHSVTRAGRLVTRSTSNTSDRRELRISNVMSTTPTSIVSTLSTKTPYTSDPTHSAAVVAVTAIMHMVSTRMPAAV